MPLGPRSKTGNLSINAEGRLYTGYEALVFFYGMGSIFLIKTRKPIRTLIKIRSKKQWKQGYILERERIAHTQQQICVNQKILRYFFAAHTLFQRKDDNNKVVQRIYTQPKRAIWECG